MLNDGGSSSRYDLSEGQGFVVRPQWYSDPLPLNLGSVISTRGNLSRRHGSLKVTRNLTITTSIGRG